MELRTIDIQQGICCGQGILSSIEVYPNPATDVLHLSIKGYVDLSATITNIDGKVVKEITKVQDHRSIDISKLVSGIYTIKVTDHNDKLVLVSKFIKIQ